MGAYWSYIHNHYKWYAWHSVGGETQVKLGPFNTLEEAQEAVEEYENSNI